MDNPLPMHAYQIKRRDSHMAFIKAASIKIAIDMKNKLFPLDCTVTGLEAETMMEMPL